MDIKFLIENTTYTQQEIGKILGYSQQRVSGLLKKLYSGEYRKSRKVNSYRNSKLGNKNPMTGKFLEKHPNFIGLVGDSKGYMMRIKPDWYTGRKHSKHIFEHHYVVCTNLGITQVPKGWCVHHCDENKVNNDFDNLVLMTISDHMKLHSQLKGVTTISKESTLKWVEAHGTLWREDIVSSAWEHAAPGQELTTPVKDK
jgi:hypothetical protein